MSPHISFKKNVKPHASAIEDYHDSSLVSRKAEQGICVADIFLSRLGQTETGLRGRGRFNI